MVIHQEVDSDTEYRLYQISQTPLGVANVEWSPNGQSLWLNVVTGPMIMGRVPTNALVINRDTHKGWTTEQLGRYWPTIPNHNWSPDGQQLAYIQDGQLWVADADEQNPRSFPLPRETTRVGYPSHSPDGTKVALLGSRTEGGEYHCDVWVLDLVSGTQKQAGKDVDGGRPIWSPGGNALAMLGESSSDNIARLWIMEITSGQSVSADIGPLPGTEGSLSLPVWLLDGQKVLVTLPLKPGVWMVDLDGNVERLDERLASRHTTRSKGLSVPYRGSFCDGAVASPDGNYVVYTAEENRMYVTDLRTQSVVDLGRGELCHSLDGIVWAPTRPQFLHWVKKIHPLELVHAQDGSTRQLAPDGQWPAWSPDGQQMVYMDDDQLWSICLDNMSSERPTYVSPSDPEKRRWGAPYNYNVAPQWSPDGSAIAFVAFLGDHPEAYLLELEDLSCSTGSGSD